MESHNNDPYKSCDYVDGMIGKVPSKDKRQFLNAVCDWFQNFFE